MRRWHSLITSAFVALAFMVPAAASAQLVIRNNPNGVYQYIRSNKFPDPAVGVGIVAIAPPAGICWRVITGHIRLQTSATAANRFIIVNFQDSGGETYGPTGPKYVQTASKTRSYALMPGINPDSLTTDEGHLSLPIAPDTWVGGGASAGIVIITTGMQAGDQLSDINFLVEERACSGTL